MSLSVWSIWNLAVFFCFFSGQAKWAHNKALQQRDMDRRLEVTSAYATACEEVRMN